MDHALQFFQNLDNLVWGAPLLVLLVGTGIYLTLRLGLLQIRYLPKAFRLIFTEDKRAWGYFKLWSSCDRSSSNCRDRKYCRGRNCYPDGWTGCPLLDVDGCFLWDGHQVCRRSLSH